MKNDYPVPLSDDLKKIGGQNEAGEFRFFSYQTGGLKMKKIFCLAICFFFLVTFICGNQAQEEKTAKAEEKEAEIPAVGSVYEYSGAQWYVRGAAKKPFEYTATGESLSLVVLDAPAGTIVLVPKKGEVVRVDPTIPAVYINGVEDKDLRNNSYFKRKTKDKVFLLLEYKRN